MNNAVVIHRARTNIITVNLGMDVSDDIITSEIRTQKNPESDLIADWDVTYATDGTDGELILTLDNLITGAITQTRGFMDLKRVTAGGEPVSVFAKPVNVEMIDIVTA